MTCLVLRQNGAHHTVEDFSMRGKEPKDEVQIYTWRDATLRELTDLVRICHVTILPWTFLSFLVCQKYYSQCDFLLFLRFGNSDEEQQLVF